MTDPLQPLTSAELIDLKAKAKAATPGNWRKESLGGCSTVLLPVNPQHGDTRAGSYGYRDKEYCVAYPFQESDTINGPGRFRWDFVCFSHENAAHIAAANPETILRLIAMIERLQSADMKREIENAVFERVAEWVRFRADLEGDVAEEIARALRADLITPAKTADTEG